MVIRMRIVTRRSWAWKREGEKKNDRKKWCTYHTSNSHLNEECYQQKRSSKFNNSSSIDDKNSEIHKPSFLIIPLQAVM